MMVMKRKTCLASLLRARVANLVLFRVNLVFDLLILRENEDSMKMLSRKQQERTMAFRFFTTDIVELGVRFYCVQRKKGKGS